MPRSWVEEVQRQPWSKVETVKTLCTRRKSQSIPSSTVDRGALPAKNSLDHWLDFLPFCRTFQHAVDTLEDKIQYSDAWLHLSQAFSTRLGGTQLHAGGKGSTSFWVLPLSDDTNFVVAQSTLECWEMTRRYKDKFNVAEVRAIACSPSSHAAERSYVLVVFQSLPYESFWRWRWGPSTGSCNPSFPLCRSMFHTVHTGLSILKFPQLDLPFPSL